MDRAQSAVNMIFQDILRASASIFFYQAAAADTKVSPFSENSQPPPLPRSLFLSGSYHRGPGEPVEVYDVLRG